MPDDDLPLVMPPEMLHERFALVFEMVDELRQMILRDRAMLWIALQDLGLSESQIRSIEMRAVSAADEIDAAIRDGMQAKEMGDDGQ